MVVGFVVAVNLGDETYSSLVRARARASEHVQRVGERDLN